MRFLVFVLALFYTHSVWAACANISSVSANSSLVVSFIDARTATASTLAASEGRLVFDGTSKTLKYCNGTTWVELANAQALGTARVDALFIRPNTLSMADLYNAAMAAGNTDSFAMGLVNATALGLQNQETVFMIADGQTNDDDAMSFVTYNQNGLSRVNMRIRGTGNVGIGNINPAHILSVGDGQDAVTDYKVIEVNSAGYAGILVNGDYRNVSGEPGGAFVRLAVDSNSDVLSEWGALLSAVQSTGQDGRGGSYTGTTNNSVLLGTLGNMPLHLGTSSAVHATITTAGNIGIGRGSASYKLHVDGVIAGAGAYVNTSDKRLKENVTPLPYGLAEIMRLKPVQFEWTNKTQDWQQGKKMGLLAQEVEGILPEVVSTADDDMHTKSIAYGDIVPVLIQAIQELQAEIETLKAAR